jgi:hypothetical protein
LILDHKPDDQVAVSPIKQRSSTKFVVYHDALKILPRRALKTDEQDSELKILPRRALKPDEQASELEILPRRALKPDEQASELRT